MHEPSLDSVDESPLASPFDPLQNCPHCQTWSVLVFPFLRWIVLMDLVWSLYLGCGQFQGELLKPSCRWIICHTSKWYSWLFALLRTQNSPRLRNWMEVQKGSLDLQVGKPFSVGLLFFPAINIGGVGCVAAKFLRVLSRASPLLRKECAPDQNGLATSCSATFRQLLRFSATF